MEIKTRDEETIKEIRTQVEEKGVEKSFEEERKEILFDSNTNEL